ncbi:MAG: 3-deoxy-8-phosphooctulonate synthase [Acetomicrobium sp.]|jgi:2-dehydro-3-deoxyphosphooctonate aldolase (KDO 8-P synthase)|uniref:3-deoxy-8-phosphooctulonate synthase n=1 Tax=Acetomicrobium TaxID=49894 RepID=UPI0026ED265F|nr:3-deoxy-8-phosphooctulonate synthase [Acetomicrobium mobile]HOB10560.1 3-deoxy-8-phosphooctulonate synthase [Acetomicrobium sp.]HQA36342.1 3-deoxy-8-phosphooctulonate synthase [Acetomicrobium sp.]HQC87935.1 3-deoxy-8-phosphooctulonate synthase [Acetomicrobium sp.]
MVKKVKVGDITIGEGRFVLVAGPCVLESLEMALEVAAEVKNMCDDLGLAYIFKSSFDKANRTSIHSFRGPGLDVGLGWLEQVKSRLGVPVLTDIHEPNQAELAARVVDVIQIPAFLCRQTDLLVSAAETGKPLNIKKAQFMSPYDIRFVLEKARESGNDKVILCERGVAFGYNELVVDFRSIPIMRSFGCPVMFDATHSVQMPGGLGGVSGGDRRFVSPLARAAVSIGIDALFMEVHPSPNEAKSDGPNMIALSDLRDLLGQLVALDDLVKGKLGYVDVGEA